MQQSSEFSVPYRFKIVFVWISIFAACSLAAYQYDKRTKYWSLHVSNVMQSLEVASHFQVNENLETLFEGKFKSTHNANNENYKLTIYHFWATWCAPCLAELPTLNELQRRLGSDIRVITIATDENKESVVRFFASGPPQFQVRWDQSQLESQAWGVQKYPETFLLKKNGKRITKFLGPRDWSSPEAMDYFYQMLAESP